MPFDIYIIIASTLRASLQHHWQKRNSSPVASHNAWIRTQIRDAAKALRVIRATKITY